MLGGGFTMKSETIIPIFLFFILLCSPSWAIDESILNPIDDLDYIIFKAKLLNYDKEPEIDGLKVRIYYINRRRDEAISWEWPYTDVIYNIYKSRTRESEKDIKPKLNYRHKIIKANRHLRTKRGGKGDDLENKSVP
jgi:hypothetical protein